MSFVRRQIYVDKDNLDIFDTLNEPFMESIPKGMVADTQENRLKAAIACIYSLTKQVITLTKEVITLQNAVHQNHQRINSNERNIDIIEKEL